MPSMASSSSSSAQVNASTAVHRAPIRSMRKASAAASSSNGEACCSSAEKRSDTFPDIPFLSDDQPRVWRQRPQHYRRASQPANNHILQRRARPIQSSDESSSAFEEGSHSSSEDEWDARQKHESLEYLDLSISLPYALVSLRDHLLVYTSQVEHRVRSLYPFLPTETDTAPRADSNLPAIFYSHLEALKDELRAMVNALPSPSAALNSPLSPGRAGAAFVARGQSLASDWERLSRSIHTTLAIRPDLPMTIPKSAHERAKAFANELTSLPVLPPFGDLTLAAIWAQLANALPTPQGKVLLTVQRRFETLQDAVRAMALRDLLFSAKDADEQPSGNACARPSAQTRRQSFIASQQALARQFESIYDSVKAKGEEVRMLGHARASSMVKAARDAEEHIYSKAVELARNGQRLIRYEHLPELWRNNEHILSGYRFIPKEEWTSLLKSTFQIHNETGNIMTHLVGALIVTPLFWPAKEQFDDMTTPMDRMVQTIYLFAALKCLILSVSWHVMAGCSDACLFERFACVDYTGIAWLVAASVWTLVYNAFYCQPNLAMVYSFSTLLVGLVGAIVPWAAWFNERQNKPVRIAVFLAMCFTGLAPFTHALLSHGFYKTVSFFGAILPSLAAYVFGLVFYATQFPECLYPGRFDVVGHAHQIWHISIVIAILLHYRATFFWHDNRFNFSCAAAMPETTPLLSNRLAIDLNVADEMVHGWRIIAGRIGDGLVGRIWDRCVDTLMSIF